MKFLFQFPWRIMHFAFIREHAFCFQAKNHCQQKLYQPRFTTDKEEHKKWILNSIQGRYDHYSTSITKKWFAAMIKNPDFRKKKYVCISKSMSFGTKKCLWLNFALFHKKVWKTRQHRTETLRFCFKAGISFSQIISKCFGRKRSILL